MAVAVQARPQLVAEPVLAVQPFAHFASQYHAQDELGQARFGYAHPGQASTNYRDALGNQIGSYAYFNPEGKEVRVSYTADHRGFRVLSNDLPVAPAPVQDTPEVAMAKAAHLAAKVAPIAAPSPVVADAPVVAPVAAVAEPVAAPVATAPVAAAPVAADPTPVAAAPVVPVAPADSSLPVPVQDTPEVAAAKREHAAQWIAAKNAADAANLRNQQAALHGSYYGAAPLAYNYGVAPMAYSTPYYGVPYGGIHPAIAPHRGVVHF